MDASRFLSQASLGADMATIKHVADIGFEGWIDEQLALPVNEMLPQLNQVNAEVIEWFLLNGGDPADLGTRPSWSIFNYTWWENHMAAKDLLRQRVALALSEIFVISFDSELSGFGDGLADYYDIL